MMIKGNVNVAEKDRFRKKMIHIKLTEEEDEILNQNAFELNISKSEFVRHIILYGRLTANVAPPLPRETIDKIDKLIYEVNKIGVNANQVAYYCNVKQNVDGKDVELIRQNMIDTMKLLTDMLIELGSK